MNVGLPIGSIEESVGRVHLCGLVVGDLVFQIALTFDKAPSLIVSDHNVSGKLKSLWTCGFNSPLNVERALSASRLQFELFQIPAVLPRNSLIKFGQCRLIQVPAVLLCDC